MMRHPLLSLSVRPARLVPAALFALVTLLTPSQGSANTPEDVQGVGGRMIAMGGAGTAASTDFSSAYYNPANLSRCSSSQVGLSIRQTMYNLDVDDETPGADPTLEGYPDPKELRNQTRISIGFCNHLPFGLSFGMSFGVGLQNPMTLDQSSLNQRPHWLLYGEQLEQLSIVLALAWQPIPQLSFGLGASILVHSDLTVATDIAVTLGGSDATSEVVFQWNLKPVAALYAGVHVAPIEQLHIGIAYRGALFHDLNTPVNIDAGAVGLSIPLNIFVESAAWYSPQQLAFGVSGDPLPWLTVAMDLTWYNYAAHPGPYMVATADDPVIQAAGVNFPEREDFGMRNVVALRLGAEARFVDDRLALRFGWGLRPSPVARPGTSAGCQARTADASAAPCQANIIDGRTNSIAFGGGYTFGELPDQERDLTTGQIPRPAESPRPRSANPQTTAPAPSPRSGDTPADTPADPGGQPSWATGAVPEPPADPEADGGELTATAHPAGVPRVDLDAHGERTYDPHRAVGARASVDVFVRITKMQSRSVSRDPLDTTAGTTDGVDRPPRSLDHLTNFSYGGTVFDIGVTITLGWY